MGTGSEVLVPPEDEPNPDEVDDDVEWKPPDEDVDDVDEDVE
jgi:hypothetical protein